MIESRAYDNEHGDPVVVLVVTGTHDVSRLVNLFKGGMNLVEHMAAGETILRQVKRHSGGQAALKLLAAHGGPDFTASESPWLAFTPEVQRLIRLAISDPGSFVPREEMESVPNWSMRAVVSALGGA